jgi:hypothetical protein
MTGSPNQLLLDNDIKEDEMDIHFSSSPYYARSQDSTVGIATGYRLDYRMVGDRVPVGSRIFSTSFRPALGSTHPPIQWIPEALSLGVNRPGHETGHLPPASTEVKKMWIYTSTPPYIFVA